MLLGLNYMSNILIILFRGVKLSHVGFSMYIYTVKRQLAHSHIAWPSRALVAHFQMDFTSLVKGQWTEFIYLGL